MKKIEAVYTPYLNDRENKNRIEIVSSSSNLSTGVVLLVACASMTLNSIKIYDAVFGSSKEVSTSLVDDIHTIVMRQMFDLNEIIPLDMDVVSITVKSILNRLYPNVSINSATDFVLLLNNNTGVSTDILDSISTQSYLSNRLFNSITELFNLVGKYNIVYTGDNEIDCTKKL